MTKVLFITGKLQEYRIPIFNIIGKTENIELSVAHAGKPLNIASDSFTEIILKERHFGGFTLHDKTLKSLCDKYDVVVAMFYVQKLSFLKLAFIKRNFKLIYWGIGVKASQKSKYDSPGLSNLLRYMLIKRADAMIFYSDYPIAKYIGKGMGSENLFVMNNTVKISETISKDLVRDKLIFVGTLNKSKKIFQLLESYYAAFNQNQSLPKLDVIGDGADFVTAKEWVKQHNMENQIFLYGSIFNEQLLEKHFRQAIACISPGQAGLSVLKSMGYGVPFITKFDAITGGERFNIQNDFNGILYKSEEDLTNILLNIASNIDKYLKMGVNAKEYYNSNRTPKHMAQGFIDAVKYVIQKK
ncbi:MAG: glycosyltransferase [Prolixibacteraceae bacterium]|nr:glycosyltransferase [Prolixibacteraceae bacterium]